MRIGTVLIIGDFCRHGIIIAHFVIGVAITLPNIFPLFGVLAAHILNDIFHVRSDRVPVVIGQYPFDGFKVGIEIVPVVEFILWDLRTDFELDSSLAQFGRAGFIRDAIDMKPVFLLWLVFAFELPNTDQDALGSELLKKLFSKIRHLTTPYLVGPGIDADKTGQTGSDTRHPCATLPPYRCLLDRPRLPMIRTSMACQLRSSRTRNVTIYRVYDHINWHIDWARAAIEVHELYIVKGFFAMA
jgi:hypothetical protein